MFTRQSPLAHKVAFCTFVFSLGSSAVFAAPSITSVTQSNGTFSISGTAFGTKSSASPLRYDDFEEATEGEGVSSATNDYWLKREGDAYPEMMISSESQRSPHSSLNASAFVEYGVTPIQYHNDIGFAKTGKVFISFWMRPDFDSIHGLDNAIASYQQKIITIAASIDGAGRTDTDDSATSLYNWIRPACTNPNVDVWYQQMYSTSNEGSRYFPNDTLRTEHIWYHVIRRIDQGSPGNSDGQMWDYIGNATGYVPNSNNGTGKNFLAADDTFMDDMKFFNYFDKNATENISYTYYYDDIYIDNSWATVWLGNAATYDACTHFEMQIPTAWTATAITVDKVMGKFVDGETAYLYVMDENGEVNSAGYEITLVETNDATTFPWLLFLPAINPKD